MKAKQAKEHIGKLVTYRTAWDTFHTSKLKEVDGAFLVFQEGNARVTIKVGNVVQIKEGKH